MQINPYLSFDGRCEEAFTFYAEVFHGDFTTRMTYGGSPMEGHIPEGFADKLMHARVSLNGQVVMGSDSPPGRYEAPRGMTLSVSLTDTAEAERIFTALSDGANIGMPLQKTFWARAFGMLTDRFGIAWMVNCE